MIKRLFLGGFRYFESQCDFNTEAFLHDCIMYNIIVTLWHDLAVSTFFFFYKDSKKGLMVSHRARGIMGGSCL